MIRKNSIELQVVNGIGNLPVDMQALFWRHKVEPGRNTSKEIDNVIWIFDHEFDILAQIAAFWSGLISGALISTEPEENTDNFKVRVLTSIDDAEKEGLSNDNMSWWKYVNDSRNINTGTQYVSNADYKTNFILTSEFINSLPNIKLWINQRGLSNEYDLTKTDLEIKEDVKIKENLIIQE